MLLMAIDYWEMVDVVTTLTLHFKKRFALLIPWGHFEHWVSHWWVFIIFKKDFRFVNRNIFRINFWILLHCWQKLEVLTIQKLFSLIFKENLFQFLVLTSVMHIGSHQNLLQIWWVKLPSMVGYDLGGLYWRQVTLRIRDRYNAPVHEFVPRHSLFRNGIVNDGLTTLLHHLTVNREFRIA